VIDTELSWAGADQPDKEQHIQDFGKVEEIVEPVRGESPFGKVETALVTVATTISINKATLARLDRNRTVSKLQPTNSTPETK